MTGSVREQVDYSGAHALQTPNANAQELRMLELRLQHEADQATKNRSLEIRKTLIQYGLGALAVAIVSAAATIITQKIAAHEKDTDRAREDVRFAHENFWKAIELYGDADRRAPVLRFLLAEHGSLGGWAEAELKRDEPLRATLEEARKQALADVAAASKELATERSARARAEQEARDAEQRLIAIKHDQHAAEEEVRRAAAQKAQRAEAEQREKVAQLEEQKLAAERKLAQAKADADSRQAAENVARARSAAAANAARLTVAPAVLDPTPRATLNEALQRALQAQPQQQLQQLQQH